MCWAALAPADDSTALAGNATSVPTATPGAIYSRQNVFHIPFRITAAAQPRQQAEQVWLYVSSDFGKSWKPHQAVAPAAGKFDFRAENDGEYWFFVRTKDVSGNLRPTGPPVAHLRVVVDTASPRIKLDAQQSPSGEITTAWEIVDAHLKPESLKLEYRQARSGGAWRQVELAGVSRQVDGRGVWRASTRWFADADVAGSLEIRLEIADAADNPAVHRMQVAAASEAPTEKTVVTTESPPREIAGGSSDSVGNAANDSRDGGEMQPQTTPWPSEALRRRDGLGGVLATEGRRFPQADGTPTRDETRQGGGPFAGASRNYPVTNTTVYPSPWRTGETASAPPRQSFPSGEPAAATDGLRERRVNTRLFALSYDVDGMGGPNLRKVELWGTTDRGRTWRVYGEDDDGRSPMTAHVEGEGVYGFRLRAHRSDGVVEPPPRAGDMPDVWVAVDLTRPSARLLGARQGEGDRWRQMTALWEASDDHLAAGPVTLAYSLRPSGPWTTIAAGVSNSGRYTWELEDRMPASFFLRLQVRDAAGNVTEQVGDHPLTPVRPRGEGRIQGVGPVRFPTSAPQRFPTFAPPRFPTSSPLRSSKNQPRMYHFR